jgi:hypothetical protein
MRMLLKSLAKGQLVYTASAHVYYRYAIQSPPVKLKSSDIINETPFCQEYADNFEIAYFLKQ